MKFLKLFEDFGQDEIIEPVVTEAPDVEEVLKHYL